MVGERDVVETLPAALSLHLEEGEMCFDLLFDVAQADQAVEVRLDLVEGPLGRASRFGKQRTKPLVDAEAHGGLASAFACVECGLAQAVTGSHGDDGIGCSASHDSS